MRPEYLLRFAGGTRHTIAIQEQRNNKTVYVGRYTGDVIPYPADSRQRLVSA